MTLEKIGLTDLIKVSPDPAWDYYTLWNELEKAKQDLLTLMIFISQQEEGSDSATDEIQAKLNTLSSNLTDMKDLA